LFNICSVERMFDDCQEICYMVIVRQAVQVG